MKTQLITFVLITLLAFGCNTTKKTTTENMQNENAITETQWKMVTFEGQDVTNSEPEEAIHFRLLADGQKITGYTGCNIFNGTYTLKKGNRIRFSPLATTRKACPPGAVNEQDVLKVFELADNFTLTADTLMLNVGRRAPSAVFVKMNKSEEPITEKYWKLKTLEGQEVTMSKNQEKEAYFMLKTDENRVTGFAGCNTFNGTYTLEKGNRIRFSHMASTLKACPDVDVNESEFLKVFELADNYTIDNDTLTLNVGKRAPLAVFEAVYFN